MLSFAQEKGSFSQFTLETRTGNSRLKDLKLISVDVESAIYNGLKWQSQKLSHLIIYDICNKMMKKTPEILVEKTNQSSAQKEF